MNDTRGIDADAASPGGKPVPVPVRGDVRDTRAMSVHGSARDASDRGGVSRRRFLTTGAVGLAGASAAACGQSVLHAPEVADGEEASPDPLSRPPAQPDDGAWTAARSRFALEPDTTYMNNASLGKPPIAVAHAVASGYEALSENPFRAKAELSDVVSRRVVPGLAALLGADADEVVLTRNASEALHMGAMGAVLRPGDEVLLTSQEHPAGRRPWEVRERRDGVKLRTVFMPSPLESEDQAAELIEAALSPATRVLAFCHVTRGGHLYPVRRLCALAREGGVLSHVDGAQAVGMFPVDLHDLDCDTYSASLHKWFLGPMGTGFLYVRAASRERVLSLFAPGSPTGAAAYQPPGTADLPVRAALAAALDFLEAATLAAVAKRTRHLSDHLKERLEQMPGATLLSGRDAAVSCPGSTIFEIAGVDAVAAVERIGRRAGIHIDEHQRDGHNAVRVSTHVYNTQAEIGRLVAELARLRV